MLASTDPAVEDLIAIQDASVVFSSRSGLTTTKIDALSDVALRIAPKDMIVVVGESGSGKTTLGRLIAGLQKPTAGRVAFNGTDIWRLKHNAQSDFRRSIQLLHQDPFTTLNPSLTVERSLVPAIMRWKIVRTRQEARKKAGECLGLVGLSPEEFLQKYPHQMSGGQRQRVAIARCISIEPKLMILDEPVSMIDVSLRIGILDTLLNIRERLGTAFVFITHDFAVARYFCEKAGGGRTIVLYLGKIMESGGYEQIIGNPSNPYTIALLAAAPDEAKVQSQNTIAKLAVTDAFSSNGCRFEPRCSYAQKICRDETPKLVETDNNHYSACHFALQVRDQWRTSTVSQHEATKPMTEESVSYRKPAE